MMQRVARPGAWGIARALQIVTHVDLMLSAGVFINRHHLQCGLGHYLSVHIQCAVAHDE